MHCGVYHTSGLLWEAPWPSIAVLDPSTLMHFPIYIYEYAHAQSIHSRYSDHGAYTPVGSRKLYARRRTSWLNVQRKLWMIDTNFRNCITPLSDFPFVTLSPFSPNEIFRTFGTFFLLHFILFLVLNHKKLHYEKSSGTRRINGKIFTAISFIQYFSNALFSFFLFLGFTSYSHKKCSKWGVTKKSWVFRFIAIRTQCPVFAWKRRLENNAARAWWI